MNIVGYSTEQTHVIHTRRQHGQSVNVASSCKKLLLTLDGCAATAECRLSYKTYSHDIILFMSLKLTG